MTVDATGDLDLCARAGLEFEADAKAGGGGIAHCLNTGWLWAGVDFARWLEFKRAEPAAHRQLMAEAGDALGFGERPVVGWSNDVALFLGPRLTGYSGVDVTDLTRVEVESRRRMVAHLDYFRRHTPGFGHAWQMLSAPQIGVRHTRRLVGRHKLTSEDWKAGSVFEDEIGVSPSPSQKFANVSVPYRPLLARNLDNLLGARAPHGVRSADPGVHARDPPVLADRAGRRRGSRPGGGARDPGGRRRHRLDAGRAAPPAGLSVDGRRIDGRDRRRAAARSEGLDHS